MKTGNPLGTWKGPLSDSDQRKLLGYKSVVDGPTTDFEIDGTAHSLEHK